MSPEGRRRTVQKVRRRLGEERISERRACRALGQPRSTQRYGLKRPDMDRRLLEEMRGLVEAHLPGMGASGSTSYWWARVGG